MVEKNKVLFRHRFDSDMLQEVPEVVSEKNSPWLGPVGALSRVFLAGEVPPKSERSKRSANKTHSGFRRHF